MDNIIREGLRSLSPVDSSSRENEAQVMLLHTQQSQSKQWVGDQQLSNAGVSALTGKDRTSSQKSLKSILKKKKSAS